VVLRKQKQENKKEKKNNAVHETALRPSFPVDVTASLSEEPGCDAVEFYCA
jgi:hypothetical protein